MRPRKAKRVTTLATLGFVAIGGVVGMLSTAVARADSGDYAVINGNEICGQLMMFPSAPGVSGSIENLEQQLHVSKPVAQQVVYLSVTVLCPWYAPAWNRYMDLEIEGGRAHE